MPRGRVLVCAGSDSGGGAGIQADIKAVTALGGYAATAVTALTAQDTRGVAGVIGVPGDFIALQIRMVLEDLGADAVKTGMLADAPTIAAVCDALAAHGAVALAARGADAPAARGAVAVAAHDADPLAARGADPMAAHGADPMAARGADPMAAHGADAPAAQGPAIPLVVDPVMVAKGGHRLLAPEAVATLRERLLPMAAVITPNIPEAEALSGLSIPDVPAMHRVAEALLRLGVRAVLLKGGHGEGPVLTDLLATPAGTEAFESPRIATRHTHGTGCTLASALACGLAQGMGLRAAVVRARAYVRAAMLAAPGFGGGHGPLGHGVTLDPARLDALR